jgi:putative phosphotransacetylase
MIHMLRGKKTRIRPLETDDLEQMYNWYSDPEFAWAVSGGWPPASFLRREEIAARFYEDDPNRYAILNQAGELIGTIGFDQVNPTARSARLFLGLGRSENRRRGLGADALFAFCRYLFAQCNFRRLTAETWEGNPGAAACYRRAGFTLEGTLREAYYAGGEYRNGLIFALLKKEFAWDLHFTGNTHRILGKVGADAVSCPPKEDFLPMLSFSVNVGVSNRHLHLSPTDLAALFGEGYSLTKTKDLSQPGQFACAETVTLIGPKNSLPNVRVLGPARPETQVELAQTDAVRLGIKAALRDSGNLEGTEGLTLEGPNGGRVVIPRGVIRAQRHLHMTPAEAEEYGLHDQQIVKCQISGPRGGVLDNVLVRVRGDYALDLHIDTDEANGLGAENGDRAVIIIE